jgi:hypothetical protein
LGIGIPQSFPWSKIDPVGIQAYLERADGLGFDSAWTQEQILGVNHEQIAVWGSADDYAEQLDRIAGDLAPQLR